MCAEDTQGKRSRKLRQRMSGKSLLPLGSLTMREGTILH
jgi:hypothetical protein